jgi:hypothetical protein
MNSILERILNKSSATIISDGRKITIGFFQSHWELSTPIMLEIEAPLLETIVESLASINLLKWPEKIALGFEPMTSTISLHQTISIPSDPHHFEKTLSEFLEIVKEWEEILLYSSHN